MAAFWSRLCGGWLVVATAGWAAYYLAGGGGDDGHAAGSRAASWLLGVPVAIVVGLVVARIAERRPSVSPVAGLLVVATGAWGLANAIGWTVDVTVGGPATGLVTGCLLVAATDAQLRARRRILFAIILLGFTAMVVARLVAGVDALVPRTLLPVLAGIGVVAGAWRAFGVRAPLWPVVVLVLAWAFSWLAAFEIARQLPVGLPAGVYAVTELGLACAIGGGLTGLVWRSRSGEPVFAVAGRWGVSGVAGTILGLLLAEFAWAVGAAPARAEQASELWAAGTTFGLGLAAAYALRPTFDRTITAGADAENLLAEDRR